MKRKMRIAFEKFPMFQFFIMQLSFQTDRLWLKIIRSIYHTREYFQKGKKLVLWLKKKRKKYFLVPENYFNLLYNKKKWNLNNKVIFL